ncbi:MAG: hypothetical protein DRI61_03395, partial [Chloroflexi bacterium]
SSLLLLNRNFGYVFPFPYLYPGHHLLINEILSKASTYPSGLEGLFKGISLYGSEAEENAPLFSKRRGALIATLLPPKRKSEDFKYT